MSSRLPRIEGHELVRALRKVGFEEVRQKGSHVHLFREADGRRATVPVHAGRTLPPGTLSAILNDIDMTAEDLRRLI